MLLAAIFSVLSFPASAQTPDGLFAKALEGMSLERGDLASRPARWDTRSALKSIEALLEDPLKIPDAAQNWSGALSRAAGLADMMDLAGDILGTAPEMPKTVAPAPALPENSLPAPLSGEVRDLVSAIAAAKPLLDKAVASIPKERREAVLAAVASILKNEERSRLEARPFEDADAFDLKSLLSAAQLVARAAEGALPGLKEDAKSLASPRVVFDTSLGKVLIAGSQNEVFTAQDLEGAVLVIHLGGDSRYEAPAASAGPGQIRVVIDLGRNVEAPGAGSGVFGIGLAYFPDPDGTKRLRGGDISLGAGLFGVGGLAARGTLELAGGRFAMGAGAYGLGLFSAQGAGARLSTRFAGQGFGFSRGVGLFRLRGDGARIEGGVNEPDPHEAQASLSFCQGAGLGERAFAAGGAGLALVEGSGAELTGSYFAQGAGYWHGFGSLAVTGDGNKLKARRYDQGSGVHTAVGALTIKGDKNETVNWGVGPAYGWDFGMGALSLEGNDNSLYAEWGAGHGDINGHALASIIGDRNKLSLPEFGSGAFKRNTASYGLAAVAGKENSYRFSPLKEAATGFVLLAVNPWGVLQGDLTLDPKLSLAKPQWPDVAREKQRQEDRAALEERMKGAGPAEWLSIASAMSLDGSVPGRAIQNLFALSPSSAALLAGLVSSDRFDEFIWLRPLLASLGEPAARAVITELAAAKGTRKAMLLGLLAYAKTDAAVPEAVKVLSDGDWRLRRAGAALLGALFDREEGEEPGRLRLFEAMEKVAAGSVDEKGFFSAIGFKRQTELFGALALDAGLSGQDRMSFLVKAPGPFDPLGPEPLREFARIVAARGPSYREALAAEQKSAAALEGKVRSALSDALADSDAEVSAAAVIALGQLGRKEDAPRLAAFLEDDRALLRDAAAAALGKMGKAGAKELEKALASPKPRTRSWAALGFAQSSDAGVLSLLAKAFADADEGVRRSAVSALAAVQNPLKVESKKFAAAVSALAEKDPSPSVRAAAAALAPGL